MSNKPCDLCGQTFPAHQLYELRWWDRATPRMCAGCVEECTPRLSVTAEARRARADDIDMERMGNMPGDPMGTGGG